MTLVKFNSEKTKKNGTVPSLGTVFDSIFDDTFFSDRMITRVPATNISESADHYHVELAAPGLKKEDFKLKLEGDVLSISVERPIPEPPYGGSTSFCYGNKIRDFHLR
jgi:HSP20 family protein